MRAENEVGYGPYHAAVSFFAFGLPAAPVIECQPLALHSRGIGISLPNNQRQHRTLHIQEDVLPYALC